MKHKLEIKEWCNHHFAYLDGEPCRHPDYLYALFQPRKEKVIAPLESLKEKELTPLEYQFAKCFSNTPEPYIRAILFPFLIAEISDTAGREVFCFSHCNGIHETRWCFFSLPSSLCLFSFYCVYAQDGELIVPPLPNEPSYHDPITTLFLRCWLLNDEKTKRYLIENTEGVAQWLEFLIAVDKRIAIREDGIQKTRTGCLNYVDPFVALGALIHTGGPSFVTNLLFVPDPPPASDTSPVPIKKILKKMKEIVDLLLLPFPFEDLKFFPKKKRCQKWSIS